MGRIVHIRGRARNDPARVPLPGWVVTSHVTQGVCHLVALPDGLGGFDNPVLRALVDPVTTFVPDAGFLARGYVSFMAYLPPAVRAPMRPLLVVTAPPVETPVSAERAAWRRLMAV